MSDEKKEALKSAKKNVVFYIKKYKAVLIVLLTGVLLLASGGWMKGGETKKTETEDLTPVSQEGFDLASFQGELETQLAGIKGVGRVSLMLSLDQTEEAVYAVDYKESQTGADSRSYESGLTIVASGSSVQEPVSIKRIYPAFRGAVVLCDGADNTEVQYAVTQAVSTICGIGTDKVSVLKMASAS